MNYCMDTETRRHHILKTLAQTTTPLTGTTLAGRFSVSRQVIVQDIAVLRASGQEILASPQGYYLYQTTPETNRIVVAVCHTPEQTEDELLTLIDTGVEVVDVVVEHEIYGELRGMLHIASRDDVYIFMKQWLQSGSRLLSELTEGLHLHTLEARRPSQLERARNVLRARGYLVE